MFDHSVVAILSPIMRRSGKETIRRVDGGGGSEKAAFSAPFKAKFSSSSLNGSRHGTSLMWWMNFKPDMYALVEEGRSFLTVMQ
jgi:hypothetical protein